MRYVLGIDLGTTFSAAAVSENGRTEVVNLGERSAQIPSVVLLRADGEVLVGEPAERRAVSEQSRTAREFKRRLGDPTPMLLAGTPYGAESLMAYLLRSIVERVIEQRGERPAAIVISHPANYGPYKLDLLRQAVRLADIGDAVFITEPEAAAIHYAGRERIEAGETVAVYDFGGGTFDAAVLRRTADGAFELLGTPEGMERLGGIDFDQATFGHVRAALGGALEALDPADLSAIAAIARLREECRSAKEALSSDTDITISVLLPNVQTEVRLTRAEIEAMIRPRVAETITTLERAVRSAGLELSDVSKILLVGGTSRIPLVAQMVRDATNRPIAVDAHPKFAIALGAARSGEDIVDDTAMIAAPIDEPMATAPAPVAPPEAPPAVSEPSLPVAPAEPPSPPPEPVAAPAQPITPAPAPAVEREPSVPGRRLPAAALASIAALILIAVVAGVLLLSGGDDDKEKAGVTTDSTTATSTSTSTTPTTAVVTTPIVQITGITREGGTYAVAFTPERFDPLISPTEGTQHIHFFWNTVPPENAGTNGHPPEEWIIYDGPSPFREMTVANRPDGATQICSLVADHVHAVTQGTGSCWDIPD